MRFLLIILIITFITNSLSAQGYGAIVTDRPDQTESAVTVPKGRLQIETGFVFTADETDLATGKEELENFDFATTLFRYGLTKKVELRVGSMFSHHKTIKTGGETTNTGINGLYVGTKIHFLKESGIVPDAALLLSADLPVGSDALVPEKTEPQVLLAVAHTLNNRLGLGYNIGSRYLSSEQYNLIYSVSVGIGFSPKFGIFAEIYGDNVENREANTLIDFGLTYQLRRNLQFDLSAGRALSEKAADLFFSFGISARFPR